MTSVASRSFDSPDETRTPPKTRVEVVRVGGITAARLTLEPGWRWSEAVKPAVGTDSCQARHVGAILRGHLHIVHGDGTEADARAGDAYVVQPGHDAWVVGDEPVVALEFESAETFARS